ncbi:heme oxygenase-like protein [Irpex rosettiformis]|uniref:Heme oxygenase-like protein n=1 Tax=Irpex rosettiformis TaxID=378272 RepID=A0ACB8U837_9APHY|nr:heme oxygenase-like protein [Irpex rosettiformis]
MSTTAPSLTSHLLSLSTPIPYTAATKHEFLATAAKGLLSSDRLSLYLFQDRLYAAHGYPRFIGHILSAIPFSSLHGLRSPQEGFNRRILEVLTYSLQNVVRETGFFVETAEKYGLKLDGWRERKATRDYTAETIRVAASGGLEGGLVFLWAMERVYLDAWKYVKSQLSNAAKPPSEALAGLVDNWTNTEFEKFVKDLEDIVNGLGIQPGTEAGNRAEEIWARVIELEAAFWPPEGDIALLFL